MDNGGAVVEPYVSFNRSRGTSFRPVRTLEMVLPRVLCDVSPLGYCGDDPAKITGMPRSLLKLAPVPESVRHGPGRRPAVEQPSGT